MTDKAYIPTIGLEIHAELKTQTKMFCNSKNDADETRPNVNICPVCVAHPGSLPVINREAVAHVLRVGVALGGTLADYTEFDRKNYFYPDLPKGYQISQYEYPLVSGGSLNGVTVTRVHLEEDTASSIHSEETKTTLIDFNRSGVPLMELVTEPEIHSTEDAGTFARELQLLLRTLDVSEANMEKGEMRVEANVSVAKMDRTDLQSKSVLGTKVEIKNLNSFRAMERAVAYEIERQKSLLEKGEEVIQETRGWDEGKQSTFAQRVKEGSADYRYFPDPDIPSLQLTEIPEFAVSALQENMPELPWKRRARYIGLGAKKEDADQYVQDKLLGEFFDSVARHFSTDRDALQLASNYIANDLVSMIRQNVADVTEIRDTDDRDTFLKQKMPISKENFIELISMLRNKEISSRTAKDLLVLTVQEQKSPRVIAEEKKLFQTTNRADLENVIAAIVDKNPSVVADYRSGKESALEYLVGQGMKALRGAADASTIRDLLKARLS